jgi:hypothetical protein
MFVYYTIIVNVSKNYQYIKFSKYMDKILSHFQVYGLGKIIVNFNTKLPVYYSHMV